MKDLRCDLGDLDDKNNFGHTSTTTVIVTVTHTRVGLDGVTGSPHGALLLVCMSAFNVCCCFITGFGSIGTIMHTEYTPREVQALVVKRHMHTCTRYWAQSRVKTRMILYISRATNEWKLMYEIV